MRAQEYTEHKAATIEAALESDTQTFSELLANPDLTQEQRWELLTQIVDHDIDEDGNENNNTFFKSAVANNNLEMVAAIFSVQGLSATNKYFLLARLIDEDEDENTIITIAARAFHTAMVRLLIEQTKNLDNERFELLKDVLDDMHSESDSCLIHNEDEAESHEIQPWNVMVQVVLESCSDIPLEKKLEVFYPHYKSRPAVELIKAARYNDAESMKAIIFSLHLNPLDIMEAFNAFIEEEPAQDTILIAAVRNRHIRVVEAIFNFGFMTLEQRSKMIARENASGDTALSIASKTKNTSILNKILFNIDADQQLVLTDASLQNVKQLAIELARNGNTDDLCSIILSNTLLAQVSRTNLIQVENRAGETALSIAIKNNDVIFIRKTLLGLNIEEEFELCTVALKMAQEEARDQIIKILEGQLACNDFKKCLAVPDLTSQSLYELLAQHAPRSGKTIFMQGIANHYIDIQIVETVFAQMDALSYAQKRNILTPPLILAIMRKIKAPILRGLLKSCVDLCLDQDISVYASVFRKALILAASKNDIETCQFIFKDLRLNSENIIQLLSYPFSSMEKENLVGHTALTAAVANGSKESVAFILESVSVQQRLILLNQQVGSESVLMLAQERRSDCELYNLLSAQLYSCYREKNEQGQTLLIASAMSGNLPIVKLLLKSNISFYESESLKFSKKLLIQSFSNKTAIMHAIDNGHTRVADTLLRALKETLVKILLSKDISENEKKSIFKELLSSVSLEIKFNLLVSEDMQGMTMFMLAVEKNYLPIAQEMLARLNLDQVSTILHDRNNQGHTALGLAKEHRFQAMVQWLENLSLRLAFNTHSATVHDSVARSVIALSAHYLALSQDDNATLQSWADSAPGAEYDGAKKEAMLQVIHKNETQLEFAKLTQYCEAKMRPWVLQLNVSAEPMHQAAARGVHLIQDNQSYRNYPEPRIHVSLMQILALTWIAIEDQRECNLSVELTEQINNKKTVLIDNLFQAQRDSNLTNGKDLDPSSPDQPKCQGGFINNLMNALIGLHSRVKVVVVNKETVKLKGMCLVGTLFNSTDYTLEQVREIESTLEEDSCLTSYVQENLKPQVEGALHTEFDDFVGTTFLKVEDIPAITGAVLSFQSANSYMAVQVIQEKLAKDSRMHPKPEAQPDDGQCEQANKKFRLG